MPRPWPWGPLISIGIKIIGYVFGDDKATITGGSSLVKKHALPAMVMAMWLAAWYEGYQMTVTSVKDEEFEIQLYNRSDNAACNTATEYTKIWEALTDQVYNGGYDFPILQDAGDVDKKTYSVG